MAKRTFWMVLFGVLVVGLVTFTSVSCSTISVNGKSLGAQDTSVNWAMEKTGLTPSLDNAKKLSNLNKEAQAVYNYANSVNAEGDTWYVLTAPEKPGETYYAYKKMSGISYTWQVYKVN